MVVLLQEADLAVQQVNEVDHGLDLAVQCEVSLLVLSEVGQPVQEVKKVDQDLAVWPVRVVDQHLGARQADEVDQDQQVLREVGHGQVLQEVGQGVQLVVGIGHGQGHPQEVIAVEVDLVQELVEEAGNFDCTGNLSSIAVLTFGLRMTSRGKIPKLLLIQNDHNYDLSLLCQNSHFSIWGT